MGPAQSSLLARRLLLDGCRRPRNGRIGHQRSESFLHRSIWTHLRSQRPLPRSHPRTRARSSLSLLCYRRVLAQRPAQPTSRSTRSHFLDRMDQRHLVHLARIHQQLAASLCRSILPVRSISSLCSSFSHPFSRRGFGIGPKSATTPVFCSESGLYNLRTNSSTFAVDKNSLY